MADREVFLGNFGPYLYRDTYVYSDGKPVAAARANRFMMDDAPTDPIDVTNKAYVDSVAVGSKIAVGGIYLNTTGVNPATELGYGSWTLIQHGTLVLT